MIFKFRISRKEIMLQDCVRSTILGFATNKKEKFEEKKEEAEKKEGEVAEKFQNMGGDNMMMSLVNILTFAVMLAIILFVGKFLWNNYLTKYITILKPVPGILELLVLVIAMDLFMLR